MKITRSWAMPNKSTFKIPPINDLIARLFSEVRTSVPPSYFVACDPFVNKSPFANDCILNNDMDETIPATSHLDALKFLATVSSNLVDLMLFDPPYSPRQVSESYKKLGKSVNMQSTQASYWGNLKKEIGRIVKKDGIVVTCGWNSGGIGKENGFEITEIMLVAHGGWHNDTIVTVEIKK